MLVIKDSDIQSKKHKTQSILGSIFFNRAKDTIDTHIDSEKKTCLVVKYPVF